MSATIASLVGRAVAAHAALVSVSEHVEDEWQYVTDLGAVWRGRLDAVVAARGPESVDPEVEAAIDAAIAETKLISDPHRAMDWLSTLPQVVLAAFGEPA